MIRINKSSVNNQGFFRYTRNAGIRKLGIEKASIIGNADVGAIVGNMYGGSIEACYVSDSYVEGRDHVGSIAGAIRDNSGTKAVLKNCYATARVHSREFQARGIAGIMIHSEVSSCYYSGIATCRDRVAGIVSYLDTNPSDASQNKLTDCVNFSTYLVSTNNKDQSYRIIDHIGRSMSLSNNYSLSTTIVGKDGDQTLVATDNGDYGAEKRHGANIPGGDGNAKSNDFYTSTLHWDMENTWVLHPDGYPVLRWQQTPVHTTIFNKEDFYALRNEEVLDLSNWVSSHGLAFTFDTDSEYVSINGNQLSAKEGNNRIREALFSIEGDMHFAIEAPAFMLALIPDKMEITTVDDLLLAAKYPVADFKLGADLDLAGVSDFQGIGSDENPFTGNFDGDGHIVRNMHLLLTNNESRKGFFNVMKGGSIAKLGLINPVVGSGKQDIGGLVGQVQSGSITNCFVEGGKITGADHVGGLVGGSSGISTTEIANCYAEAEVVSTGSQAAGLIGAMKKTILTNCYASGIVKAAEENWTQNSGGIVSLIESADCELSGLVSMSAISGGNTGRFVARANENSFLYSGLLYHSGVAFTYVPNDNPGCEYATYTNEDNKLTVTGAMAKTEDELQSQATYEAISWDFDQVWTLKEGASYPVLKVFADAQSGTDKIKLSDRFSLWVSGATLYIDHLEENMRVSVYTLGGQLVVDSLVSGQFTHTLPVKGMYIVKIVGDNQVYTSKVNLQ